MDSTAAQQATPRTRTRLGKKEKAQQRKDDSALQQQTLLASTERAAAAVASSSRSSLLPPVPAVLPWHSLSNSTKSTNTTCPVLFSKDSTVCFVASGTTVKIYSVETCQLLSTLSVASQPDTDAAHHRRRALVSAIVLNPSNPLQLVVASLDGFLRIWDFTEGVLIRTLDVGAPVLHACASSNLNDHLFVAIAATADEPSHKDNDTHILSSSAAGSASSTSASATTSDRKRKRKATAEDSSALASQHDLYDDAIRSQLASVYSVSLRAQTTTNTTEDDVIMDATTPRAPARRTRLAQSQTVVALTVSASGEYLIALNPHAVNVCRTKTLQKGFTTQLESTDALTTVAFHPQQNYFATGNVKGQIKLWFDVLGNDDKTTNAPPAVRPATAMFHWHAHAVSALAFTPNGAYLLSGGEEAVLVLWQLHTGHHEFVPRLGAPILALSVTDDSIAEQQVAARLRDGSIAFIGAQKLRISKTISGLKADPVRIGQFTQRPDVRVPLAVDPMSRDLILPAGHPSSLQFFSQAEDAQTLELEVAPSNRVSSASHIPLEPTRVEHVVLGPANPGRSTSWMATLDSWSNESFAASRQLKFWQRRPGSSTPFTLTTRVDRPHDGDVTSMSFCPAIDSALLLTTATDGRIKLWSYDGQAWSCRTSLMYRAMIPADAAWSQDGSMFAVAHGAVVTLWSTFDTRLIHAFACSGVAPVSQITFAGKEGTVLLAGGEHGTMAWDLLTFEESLNLAFEVGTLTPKPKSNHVVAIEKRKTTRWSTTAAAPLASSAFVLDTSATAQSAGVAREVPFQVRQAIWVDPPVASESPFDDDDAVSLATVNESGDVCLIGAAASVGGGIAPSRLPTGKKTGQSRLFDDIFGESETRLRRKSTAPAIIASLDRFKEGGSQVLDMPAHSLPPPRALWRTLLGEYKIGADHGGPKPSVDSSLRATTDMQLDESTTESDGPYLQQDSATLVRLQPSPADALADIFKAKFLLSSPSRKAAKLATVPKSAQ
ncbi:NET1-associated nuclear protein 1 [Microbotryomycetes sp. JL221]|nr:NET1-associated nuclear protein 1 [Microbotryomycetes sp. JL221]